MLSSKTPQDIEAKKKEFIQKKEKELHVIRKRAHKENCEWCVEGYDTDKYYEHTCLEHFRKLFEQHIIPENAKDMRYVLYDLNRSSKFKVEKIFKSSLD